MEYRRCVEFGKRVRELCGTTQDCNLYVCPYVRANFL